MVLLDNCEGLTKGSHKKVKVKCDLENSEECRGEFYMEYRAYLRRTENGILKCQQCYFSTLSGRTNPNCKYEEIDDDMFSKIDSNEKAWLLGWIASDGNIRKSGFGISIKNIDVDVLEKMNRILFSNKLKISSKNNGDMVNLSVNSKRISENLVRLFKIGEQVETENSYKKSYILNFPDIEDKYIYYFVRGVFEGDGHLRYTREAPECGITSSCTSFLKEIIVKCDLTYNMEKIKDKIEFFGVKALNFLNKIYGDVSKNNEEFYLDRKYSAYIERSLWFPQCSRNCLNFRYTRMKSDVKVLENLKFKDNNIYKISLCEKISLKVNNLVFYDTGIKFKSEPGYYIDIISELPIDIEAYKLANGIEDLYETPKNSIVIPLIKDKLKNNDDGISINIIPKKISHLKKFDFGEPMELELLIKKNFDDVDGYYNNHGFGKPGDSGLDVFFPEDVTIPAKTTMLIDLKIACELKLGNRKHTIKNKTSNNFVEVFSSKPFWLMPRSSIYKTPLRMANSIGLVDRAYRNSLKAPVDNISDVDYLIKKGTRLFQIVSPSLEQFKVSFVDELSETERGGGSFGSTGI